MGKLENRQSRRVEFFNIPMGESEIRPIWVFSSGRSASAICAVVVNMSQSGIQVLTEPHIPLQFGYYQLSFLQDAQAQDLHLPDCQLALVWSETKNSLQRISGFQFVGDLPESLSMLLEKKDHYVRPFIRCEIDAIETIGGH